MDAKATLGDDGVQINGAPSAYSIPSIDNKAECTF
jgi:hypothetical protein